MVLIPLYSAPYDTGHLQGGAGNMWTGEQILEAVMTNTVARFIEVLAAPIFIWLKTGKSKKDWPKPILLGFVIIVLASCLFLEE